MEVGGSIKKQSLEDDKTRTPNTNSKRTKSKKRKVEDAHDYHNVDEDDDEEGMDHNMDHHHQHHDSVKKEQHHHHHDEESNSTTPTSSHSPILHEQSQPNLNVAYYISPTRSPLNGGGLVFLQITNAQIEISGNVNQSKVYFGDVESEIQQINNNAFIVKVPPQQQEGHYPIRIQSGNITLSNSQQLTFEYYQQQSIPTIEVDANISSTKKNQSMQPPPAQSPNKKAKLNNSNNEHHVQSIYRREWAIVIAISKYKSKKLLNQSTSINDATNIANVLEKNYGFTVCTLFNEQATRENILQLMVGVSEKTFAEDCLLIYYAGHTLNQTYPNANHHQESYICPYDCDPDRIINTGISHSTFINHRIFASKHIYYVMDTLYSGTLFKIKSPASHVTHHQQSSDHYARNRSVQLICATSDAQQRVKQGVFSKHLLNALTTMRFGSTQQQPFNTADQLGSYIQTRVMAESDGTQVPNFGKIELDDGQFMFFPRMLSGYIAELDRVTSLMSVYEDYMQNMNLGDIHTSESLMNLLKIKFYQVSKFYQDAQSSLLTHRKLVLRSDHYSFHRVNLTEIMNTARTSYLAVYRPVDEWSNAHKHQLANMNNQMLSKNPNAIAKRIFLVNRGDELNHKSDIIQLMKFHKSRGVDVRVAYLEDLTQNRNDIPHNFAIIDSRLCHVLMRQDEYPKSVLVFNRKTVADMYYSCWTYLMHTSIPLHEYLILNNIQDVPNAATAAAQPLNATTLYNNQEAFLAVTDPLLSFDTLENVKSIQHHLNPILKGFRNRFANMLAVQRTSPTTNQADLTDRANRLLFDKFQKLNMFYENVLTTFYSMGRIETYSQFYDRHRLRSQELEDCIENKMQAVFPVHSWNKCAEVLCQPHLSLQNMEQLATMNKKFKSVGRTVDCSVLFTFHEQVTKDSLFDTDRIIKVLRLFQECGYKVMIKMMESIERILTETSGSFLLIDDCLCQTTTLNNEQEPNGAEDGNKGDNNTYYLNTLSADKADVQLKKDDFNRLNQDTISVDEFVKLCE
ncbi:hypothetical protein AKO1_010790 [Acrasis kona]|uniref:IPT/TIG domain-containing protein n=1 Tax=Acrasis kona TaxID=1008807 RepID=A0AAW2YMN2_9EUKA